MRILITNTALAGRSGTEIFVAQLAGELRRRGHDVLLYSPRVGDLGLGLRRDGHLVFERIADIGTPPEVIHAHHVGPALTAITAFARAPAIFVAHSVEAEFDAMPLHPRIVRYLAVSDFVRRQRASPKLPVAAIELLRNAVDLEQFPGKPSVAARPMRGVMVTKYQSGIRVVRDVCERLGIALTEAGVGVHRLVDNLADEFARADVVFASGRSALEALAAGCAVVLTDGGQFGGLVGLAGVESLLDLNLGVRTMPHALTRKVLEEAIGAYRADEVAAVSALVRRESSLSGQADRLLDIYRAAMARGVPAGDSDVALASLIEAYVPSHGDLPWRALARGLVEDELLGQMQALTALGGSAIIEKIQGPALDGVYAALEGTDAELRRLQRSVSWRLTGPLRWVRGRFG